MKKRRRWIAVALFLPWFVATIGFCQFLFSSTWPIGSCMRLASPWNSLLYWAESGCVKPIGDALREDQWHRLAWTGGTSVVLFGIMIWSSWGSVAWRPNLRLRTLMTLIAVSAFAYVGGRETWDAWGRWDRYAQAAEHCAAMEEISGDYESEIPVGLSDEKRREWIEASLANQESFHQAKETYQRAMWRPWVRVSVDVPLW